MSQFARTAFWICWKDTWDSAKPSHSACLTDSVSKNADNLDSLSSSDIKYACDIVKHLKLLKMATTMMCDEKHPVVTLS